MTYLPGFEPPAPVVQGDLFAGAGPGDSTAAVMALVDRLPVVDAIEYECVECSKGLAEKDVLLRQGFVFCSHCFEPH